MHDILHQAAIVVRNGYVSYLADQLEQLGPVWVPSHTHYCLRQHCTQLRVDKLIAAQALQMGKQNLEKLLRAQEHGESRQVIAYALLIDLPFWDLVLSASEEVTLWVHATQLLLQVDSYEVHFSLAVLSIVDERVLDHFYQARFDWIEQAVVFELKQSN